jgi:hypothetical protein
MVCEKDSLKGCAKIACGNAPGEMVCEKDSLKGCAKIA